MTKEPADLWDYFIRTITFCIVAAFGIGVVAGYSFKVLVGC